MKAPFRLNLGSSDSLMPGHLNVDCCEPPPGATGEDGELPFLQADLCTPWPWYTSTVDEIVAHDVFEHLYKRPAMGGGIADIFDEGMTGQRAIIWCMNEAHRVLKPGGKLDLIVPSLPGVAPFCDPTHVSVWCPDLRYYFDERWNDPRGERGRLGPAYGITALFRTIGGRSGPDWKPIQYAPGAPDRHKIMVVLEAVK